MSCRTSTRLLANECVAALIGSTVRWMGGEWILRFKWGTICYFWLADCFWTVGECLFVAENAYTWRYLENTVSKIGGKILDLQPLVSVIMSQSWAPYCGLFAHETVGFHDFWVFSCFVLSLETRNLATVVYLGLSQVASTLGTPKSYGLPSQIASWACLISRQTLVFLPVMWQKPWWLRFKDLMLSWSF